MNRIEAKAHAEVMLAFANGKTIEFRERVPSWSNKATAYPWQAAPAGMNIAFNFSTHEYRVKPEPEQFFITVYGDARDAVVFGEGYGTEGPCIGSTYPDEGMARRGGMKGARVFKVIEVLA